MQSMPMNTNRQLVADRHAALAATARRGRLHHLFSRANRRPTVTLDITALENADATALTPTTVLATCPDATPESGRINKVA